MPPPNLPPQPTRFAIQKARGKGWTTLEVGDELDHARARFELMIKVNPRAYFRLIQLDYNADSAYEGMEFNWKLIELYDPTQKGGRVRPALKPVPKAGRAKEKIRLPLRFYLTVIVIGALVGLLVYLRYGLPAP
ncbi:hypothetical protein [Azospirillum soli]|uniref:hypothetical protein n=1 Tax=Azospirillum soli TaxID=1304799 RepID=UPI001AE12767|nr:hypothetical protein [Azospirillum soli]MBP2313026.1 hypothetical protein [Azospirillum soli]